MKRKTLLYSLWLISILLAACSTATPVPAQPTTEPLVVRVGYNSGIGLDDMPSTIAEQRLSQQGYTFQPTNYAKPDLLAEAMSKGDADIGFGGVLPLWTAIGKGAPIIAVMAQEANTYAILATQDIKTCTDLQDKRVGVSSETASSTGMTKAYIKASCPGTTPQWVVIADSSARAAALSAGQIDATPLLLADSIEIDAKSPGRFHRLVDFEEQLPKLLNKNVFVTKDFLAKHPQAVKDFMKTLLQVHRDLIKDPSLVVSAAKSQLDIDANLLPQMVQAHVDLKVWDVNGGLTSDALQYTLDFYTQSGGLKTPLKVADVADLSYLDAVLSELGRQ